MIRFVYIVAAGAGLSLSSIACHAQGPKPLARGRSLLDNGIRVLPQPVPGAGWVTVVTSFPVGFVNDPKGRPQLAHLVEHLTCRCATESWGPEASFALLAQKGDANAETLPGFMYLYAMAPPGDLDLALRVEMERLSSLKITAESIRVEGPKCAAEVGFTERAPRRMVGKFGLMALNQGWRYAGTRAIVKSGLETTPVDVAARFRALLHPRSMTVVIAGDFRADQAGALIRRRLGEIRSPEVAAAVPDFRGMRKDKDATVVWDSAASAVCVAYPPPADPRDRLALTYWGLALSQKLQSDPKLMALASMVESSNPLFPVGPLPFYVSATAKPGVDLRRLRPAFVDRVRAAIAIAPSENDLAMLRMMAAQDAHPPPLTRDLLKEQAGMYAAQMHMDTKRAIGAALTQAAIDISRREQTLGPDRAARLREIDSLTATRLGSLIHRSLSSERMTVTRLMPIAR